MDCSFMRSIVVFVVFKNKNRRGGREGRDRSFPGKISRENALCAINRSSIAPSGPNSGRK